MLWFTADTHLWHGNIIKYCHRPFLTEADRQALAANGGRWHDRSWKGSGASDWKVTDAAVALMNQTLIDETNRLVGPDDVLWHLGDVVFGRTDADRVANCVTYLAALRCKDVRLIVGNHDRKPIFRLFPEVHRHLTTVVEDQKIFLCHYAAAVWDQSHRRAWHLYGHSHGAAEDALDVKLPGRLSIDVGVDNAYRLAGSFRPFSFAELRDRFAGRRGHVLGDVPADVAGAPE